MSDYDVLVIGAGVSGLAAATALAETGRRVLVLEARGILGGRATAFPDRETGELVDNGQYVMFGCYHETFKLLRDEAPVHWYDWEHGKGFWCITRYDDVVAVLKDWRTFSSETRTTFVPSARMTKTPAFIVCIVPVMCVKLSRLPSGDQETS